MIGLSYDDDGNLTHDGTLEYVYDAENRMIAATPLYPVTGSKKLEAGYDYQSRRVSKRVYTYNAGTWLLDTTKTVVYDGWNVIRETTTTDTGTSTDAYVWGLDVSGTLQGAGGIGGLVLWKKDAGTFLYLYDANGNVGQLVNAATGSIAARYEYDPFGNVLVADGPEAQNNVYRFSNKPYDAETRLYYYIFRYYSPHLGRWTTRDPIGEVGGKNLYVFVKNAPLFLIDPFGLATVSNDAEMTIVLIGDNTYEWYSEIETQFLEPECTRENSCCFKCTKKYPGIPFPLERGDTLTDGVPVDDIDAFVQINGRTYKLSDPVHGAVIGGPPPTPLTFTDASHPWPYHRYDENILSTHVLERAYEVIDQLRQLYNVIVRDQGQCQPRNTEILAQLTKHIELVKRARAVLKQEYGLPLDQEPATPQPE